MNNEEEEENDEEENNNEFKKVDSFTMITTNARSITPKIDCFIEYLQEHNTSLAFITETWLSDSPELVNDIQDLELGTGYSLICKNRPLNDRGSSAGGVAIASRTLHTSLKKISLPGNDFEILFTVGTMPRFSFFEEVFGDLCVYATQSFCFCCDHLSPVFS